LWLLAWHFENDSLVDGSIVVDGCRRRPGSRPKEESLGAGNQADDSVLWFCSVTVAGCWRGILKMIYFYLIEHYSSDGPIVVHCCGWLQGKARGRRIEDPGNLVTRALVGVL
jgi:hypothetical protein